MDRVLAFSILSASPADISAGADASGSWARLSWRGMKLQDAQAGQKGGQAAEAEQQQLGKGKSQSQTQLPPRGEARRPRFAPEFDGIDCFETIVWR